MDKASKHILLVVVCIVLFLVGDGLVDSLDLEEKLAKYALKSQNTKYDIDYESEFASKSMYYYNTLDENAKAAYRDMYAAIINFDEKYTLDVNSADMQKVFKAIIYDNPEIFWVESNYRYFDYDDYVVFEPEYLYTKEEASKRSDDLETRVNEILSMASAYSTDYEKELFFHDYICENVTYDESTSGVVGSSAHNALVNGAAVCEGYARAMQILLDGSGIYNYLIVGDATDDKTVEPHMWNIVQLDGINYHLDVTWDDIEGYAEPSHLYFNINDTLMSLDHLNFKPENNNCFSLSHNYYFLNGTHLISFNSFSDLSSVCGNVLKSGKNYFEFRFQNKSDYNRAIKSMGSNSGFFDFVKSAVELSGRDLKTGGINYYAEEKLQYICIVFEEG